MSNPAVRVRHLGKRYRIGVRQSRQRGFLPRRHAAGVDGNSPPRNGGDRRSRAADSTIWALKDVSFDVGRGEVLGIIGPNGAGKSTLLKILSRITEPTEGEAQIFGLVGSLLEVGTGFHPELTGRENILLNGVILGMKRAEVASRFEEIVEFSGIEKFIDTPVKRYSSGMYVRLAFAVAAHLEPEILIVDEVLAVGDAAFQRKCLGKMDEVAGSGRTVLFVSHNMPAITSLCQRAIWLDEGHVREDGPAENSVASYLTSIRTEQTMAEGRISLTNHPGRRKEMDGITQLYECELVDDAGRLSNTLRAGRRALVRLKYRVVQELPKTQITFVCAFRDGQGQRIAYCSTDVGGEAFSELPQDGAMECAIDRLSLFPGTYYLDVGCKVSSGWSDFVYEAVQFEVVDGGFYPTDLLPPEGSGNLLLDYRWRRIQQ